MFSVGDKVIISDIIKKENIIDNVCIVDSMELLCGKTCIISDVIKTPDLKHKSGVYTVRESDWYFSGAMFTRYKKSCKFMKKQKEC